jgi:DNA-binding protein HU-beta
LKREEFRLGRMTKQQLIEAVAGRTDAKKSEVEAIAEAILKTIADSLASGERVDFRGFGSFEVKDTKARMGRNPGTGEAISIAATRKATFKPSKDLKEMLTSKSTDISGT